MAGREPGLFCEVRYNLDRDCSLPVTTCPAPPTGYPSGQCFVQRDGR